VSPVLPKFSLSTALSYSALLVWSLLHDSGVDADVMMSIDPLTGGLLLGAAGLAVGKEVLAGNRQKRAIKAQGEDEAKREASVKKFMGPEAERALKRLRKGRYGVSKAKQREGTGEIQAAAEAQAKAQRAELKRGQGPYGSGRREALMRAVSEQQQSAVAQGRLGTARLSEQVGAQQQATDRGTVAQYGQTLGGMSSAVPGMQYQTPGMGERLFGVGMQGLTGAATLGAFSGGGKGADGVLDKQLDASGAAAQYAKADK